MIFTLDDVSNKVRQQKKLGKKVGLITGCFDVLHFGHIQLFRFAKKHVDFLVVGLDNDKTISLFKGKNRPVNRIKQRIQLVSELRCIDMVFEIKAVFDYADDVNADKIHIEILKALRPDCLITAAKADKYWQTKKQRAKNLQIKFLLDREDRSNSSTAIIDKLTE
ncbi:MAG: adenylyltransferase/cytidyltransferase family protein [Patescibacteria group bacterium]|nr:adenylyltransferase/cytidyltransferase family protein [Patescibacteria group bacterium]